MAADDPASSSTIAAPVDRTETSAGAGEAAVGSTLHAPEVAAGAADLPALGDVEASAYALGDEVARGGMGRIIAARDRRLRRPVALKLLLSSSRGSVRRFEREALITARLQHPSIVRVYEAGRFRDGQPFYAMEKVRGRSLDKVIASAGALDQRLAVLPNLIAVAEALAYAHSEGIVHRDLKPANVLVGSFGETVVIDWGLAKDLRSDDTDADHDSGESSPATTDLTVAGTVMGTPAFMAPEQARGEAVDERADVYAIGAMLYTLLAGEAPYRGRSSDDVIEQVTSRPPRPLAQRVPGVPLELVAVAERAMDPDPDRRYASARELADDLERFQAGQLVAAHRYSRSTLLLRWLHRHRVPVGISGGALIVLAVTGAVAVHEVVRQRDRADEERIAALRAHHDAEAARAEAVQRADELVMEQARGVLDADPSRALAWLKELSPAADWAAARALAVTAAARGVARQLDGHTDDVEFVAFAPTGATLASASDDFTARLWDTATGVSRKLAGHGAPMEGLAWAPDGALVGTASVDGTARLWRVTTGVGRPLGGHQGAVRAIAFSADSRLVATGDLGGTVRLWEVGGGEPRVLGRHRDAVRGLAFARDGTMLYSVSEDGALGVFHVDGSGVRMVAAHASVARALAVSPDGTLVATGGEDGAARLWTRTGDPVRQVSRHIDLVRDVVFSPDGRWLASAGGDPLVQLVDVIDGGERTLEGNTSGVKDLAISPDGGRIASAGIDGTVHLWRIDGGPPRVLRGHRSSVKAVSFSADGRLLASGSDDDTIRLWRLDALGEPPAGPALRDWLEAATNLTVARSRPAPR